MYLPNITATSPAAVQIARAPTGSAFYAPAITIDTLGNAHVAWEQTALDISTSDYKRIGSGQILYAVVTAAGVINRAASIISVEPGSATEPAIAVTRANTASIFYRRNYGADAIRVRSVAPDRPPGLPEDLVRDPFPLDRITAATSRRGIELAWRHSNKETWHATWRYGWVVEPHQLASSGAAARVFANDDGLVFVAERFYGKMRFFAADDLVGDWRPPEGWGEAAVNANGTYAFDPSSGRLILTYVDAKAFKRLVYHSLGQ